MTRPSSSSSKSASYHAATGRKHRHRIPTQKAVVAEEEEEDSRNSGDADASDSEYNDESQGDEYEQFEEETKEEDDDDDDAVSESLSIAPRRDPSFSQQANSDVPESNGIEKKTKIPSISASDFPNPPQPIYVKIAPLPLFRGTPSESPITHLSRFNKVCRANNASSIEMQKRIFPVTLEEEAALWYDLNIEPYHSSLSWDEIKLSFLQAYYEIEPVEELRSELMGIHQGEKESIRSYFLRLQWILKRWPEHGLRDDVIKGVFLDGLRAEFHDWVLMQKPDSLNDALRLAFGFEQVRSVRGKKEMVPTCGFCEGPHEENSCGVREWMRELWRQSVKKEGSDHSAGKDLVRSFSMGESSGQGNIGTNEGEKGGESETIKENQCQCNKHQCWKKSLSRNCRFESSISHHE